jgi:hypothetical protein
MGDAVNFLSGAIAMGFAIAGLFFLRFWRDSRDRLFAWFAGAFFLLALQGSLTMATMAPPVYVLRLIAFVLILWAILEKNRGR